MWKQKPLSLMAVPCRPPALCSSLERALLLSMCSTMCSSTTTTRCHSPGQGQEEKAFAPGPGSGILGLLSPPKDSRVVSRLPWSRNKYWDRADGGGVPQVFHGGYH